MRNKEIILIGGGGHCRSCISVIESQDKYKIAGIIDPFLLNESVLGYPVIGNDSDLEKLRNKYKYALVTVGQIETSKIRKELFSKIQNFEFQQPVIISSHALVSPHAIIGNGTIVMHHVIVNSATIVGQNCILNNKCLIEHDVYIGDHSHISTAVIVNGNVSIGSGVFIGSNATVVNGSKLSDNKFFKANSLIKNDEDGRKVVEN